tara:strand:- start:240 stop:554 length:315 start_codon:yes stop_codon:yes gene_type:complete
MNNSFRIILTVVSFISVVLVVITANTKLTNLEDNIERVHVESIVSSGKAIYMPGNVCVLKATSDISTSKMREFAAACIRSHDNWLLIDDAQTSYIDDDETIRDD